MKASASMILDVASMVDRLIPVSEFSKGKTSHIFDDVKNNNSEYIILKNNQPTAVLISIDEYKKIKRLEAYLEQVDEKTLLEQAFKAQAEFNPEDTLTLDELMAKHGIDPAEVDAAMESVEIE
jgi:prevent-host-death family protein